jgi:hypothetical protein
MSRYYVLEGTDREICATAYQLEPVFFEPVVARCPGTHRVPVTEQTDSAFVQYFRHTEEESIANSQGKDLELTTRRVSFKNERTIDAECRAISGHRSGFAQWPSWHCL